MTPTSKTLELSAAKRLLLNQRLLGITRPTDEVIAPRAPGAATPISEEQRRIWLHSAMEPGLPIYNESITIHRRGSFNLAALEASFNEILRRHEAWRTSFAPAQAGGVASGPSAAGGGELQQVIHPELHITLPLIDLSMLPEDQREARANELATEDAREPIDVDRAPLFRARVFRLAPHHHWLQLTLHHIIFDGVSLYRVFVPELAALYGAYEGVTYEEDAHEETGLKTGWTATLPPPALQYADYAVWREREMDTPAMARHLAYWRTELAGELPVLKLPTDRPRLARASHRGAQLAFTFPEELIASLRELSRAHGVTLYVALLAGLKTLFYRYSGQQDIIIGGLADGRRRPELAGLMGYALDTFAIRTRPSGELPFSEYLSRVLHSVLGALDAAEVPFSRVVEAIEPTRNRSYHPVFQTFLALQPHAEPFPEGWELSKTCVAVQAAKFDLYIEVDDRPARVVARFTYSTDLFDAATIDRMAGHWMTLLTAAAGNPDCELSDLPLLTAAERELMLVAWNRQERPIPEETLDQLVTAQALRTPDAPAVQFEDRRWTYANLEGHAEHLAGRLRSAGARRGELVAVCLERSQLLPAALLAILKTGAAYLPLDPGTPRARRALCLEDAAARIVLTQRSLLDDLPASAGTVLLIEDLLAVDDVFAPEQDLRMEDEAALHANRETGDAAYVIHTSGSTGRPKAVAISHRALVNLLTSMQQEPGFRASDALLAVTTISFDIAALELFLPLISGGRCVIASRGVALDPFLLARAIENSGCTVLQATPSTWRALLSIGWNGRHAKDSVPLRILCGGEALTQDLARNLLMLPLELWNVYGPTETTIWSTAKRIVDLNDPISVGRPIANTTTYILDARQQPVPIGVPGELYIGGAGLAIGYRGQPRLTLEKFVSPAVSRGARLYRTGDHALYRPDGCIEIQGRADNQVKIRGHRLELEDVEAALTEHPGVAAAAARAWPDPSGGSRLIAYLVGREGPPPTAREIRHFLESRVPDYMVPSDIIAIAAMPLTANGKMDRKALPRPDQAARRVVSVAPSTQTEVRLGALWESLLGRETIGVDDNFFELGGHSLLVARLQQSIAVEFGQQISMAAVFHAPTIRLQSALLGDPGTPRSEADSHTAAQATDRSRLIPIQPKGSKPPIFWIQPPPNIENLAAALGVDQPFLGVTMTLGDLEELGERPELEDFARAHAETILKTVERGVYHLGGLCTGGILAYEVAAQLRAASHDVASLVLLDSENPVYYRRLDTLAVEGAKLRFYGRRAFSAGGLRMFFRHTRSRLGRLMLLDKAAATEMSAIDNAILAAAFRYHPPIYGGDVLLILPHERPGVVDYASGWKVAVSGTLTCVDVNGHHDELLTAGHAAGVATSIAHHFEQLDSVVPSLKQV